jgi:hypothetical protein
MRSGLLVSFVVLAAVGWRVTSISGQEARAGGASWQAAMGSARVLAPDELVVGRTVDGESVELLLETRRFVQVDLDTSDVRSIALTGLRPDDQPWGFARLPDGTRWTLVDRWTLALVSSDGRLTSRHPLARPHIGLYGLGARLLYQAFEADPRRVGAAIGPPGNLYRHALELRRAADTARGAAASRLDRLLACGTSVWPILPCWFPGRPALYLVHDSGVVDERPIDLAGVARMVIGPSRTYAVRDATVDGAGRIWVLLEQPASGPSLELASGEALVLLLLSPDGRLVRAAELSWRARLILGATAAGCQILRTDGRVARVAA